MARAAALGVLMLQGCGGPLDRVDGALELVLVDAPMVANRFAATVQTDGREFVASGARPADDVIKDFTAVPVGDAKISVELYEGDVLVDTRGPMHAEIVEGDVRVLGVDFGAGPELVIEHPAEGAGHYIGLGPVPVKLRQRSPELILAVQLTANGIEVPVTEATPDWIAQVDPTLAGPILPAPLAIVIKACVDGSDTHCSELSRTIQIHRHDWIAKLGRVGVSRPAQASEDGAIVAADEDGAVYVLSAADGSSLVDPVSLAAPVSAGVAVDGRTALVVDGSGTLRALDLADAGRTLWTQPLGADFPSQLSLHAGRLIVGAGRKLLAVQSDTGALAEISTTPAEIAAEPLTDDLGIVACDLLGNGVTLKPDESPEATWSVGAPVLARPTRFGTEVYVGTASGDLFRISSGGQVQMPTALGAPIVHAPLVVEEALVVPSGDRLAWIRGADGSVFELVGLGAAITAAPTRWSSDSVVVGLRDGRVLKVQRDGAIRVMSRIDGAVLHLLTLDAPPRVLAAGSTGDVEMLRPEEDF